MDSRQRVAIVVAHELAHQWFGNLVVCAVCSWIVIIKSLFLLFRQWTGGLIYVGEKISNPLSQCVFVGLNEGFASWIEYLAVDKCYPEFDIWTQFVADTFARFLVPDALKSSHPIEVPIGK